MEDDRWFVGRGTVQQGPIKFAKLQQAALAKKIRRDDLVWKEGFADWIEAGSVPNLFPPEPMVTKRSQATQGEPQVLAASASSNLATPIPAAKQTRANYLVRHWRGDFSLPISYWVNGSLLTVLTVLSLYAIRYSKISYAFGIFGAGMWILFLLAFTTALPVWQVVGIWRSADKHVSRGGSAGWATAAKAAMLLGLIQFVGALNTQLPLLKQSIAMMAGHEDVPHYKIRVLRNATELEVSGGLSYGTTDAVSTILDATPTVKLIHLNNVGGWITEGVKLGDLIEVRGLSTFTSRSCVSACMMAFISGKDRYLGGNGRLGFHSASVAGVGGKVAEGGNDRQREVFARHGVDPDFVTHAVTTTASDMWYPTHEELISAHVITTVVDDRDYATTNVADWHDSMSAEAQLANVPAYAAIKRHEPAEYEKLKQELVAGIQAGDSRREIAAKVRAHFQKLIPKYLKSGPDDELIAYWKTQIAEGTQLQTKSPAGCVNFFFPDATKPVDVDRLVSKEAQNADLQALGALIDATTATPIEKLTKEEAAPILTQVMRTAERNSPGSVTLVSKPETAQDKPAKLCQAELNFFGTILALPPSQAAPLLRYLLSQ
jgi:GYF domain 2